MFSVIPAPTPPKRRAASPSEDSEDECHAPAAPLCEQVKPKKPRPAPPPRRLTVANRGTISSACQVFLDSGQTAHLFSLSWRIGGNASKRSGVTEHRICDDDGINYNIGENNLSARADPTNGSDLGAAEMIGLASVAAEICEVLTDDPQSGVVVADIWATDYAPLVVGLATRLFTVSNPNAPAVSGGVRKPKNPKLKALLKEMGKVNKETELKEKLHAFYRSSWD